ncbi:hypothetical protein ABZ319_03370 [Nocardia sp. NPDC005978]|uniref:hypothetical protein n=1 Tax=Nocardia sp. NPDC005978 TaxID=3156725 RepID=UPI0033BC47AE
MRKERITTAVAGFAALAAIWAGAPAASAEIVGLDVHYDRMDGTEFLVITVQTTDCNSVQVYDNGKPVSGGPIVPWNPPYTPCTPGLHEGRIGWEPKTLGTHHIVVEQMDGELNVTSTMSTHFNVTRIPCDRPIIGSTDCALTSGSI